MTTTERSDNTRTDSPLMTYPVRRQIKRIILGFDRSEASIAHLRVASAIVSTFDAELLVVHSLPPQLADVMGFSQVIDLSVSPEDIKAEIEEIVKKIASCRCRVFVGTVTPEMLISQIALEENADLIVVGTRGRDTVAQLVLGSVSQSLLSTSDCPVLLLGPEFMQKQNLFETILFATDLDSTGLRAAQYAGTLALDLSCKLILMHVMSTKPRAEGRLREWTEERIREVLYRQLDREFRGEFNYEDLIAYGDPGQEILAAADTKSADLVIMGTGTQSPIGDHASWRTLSFVVRNARCPVLVIPPDAKEPRCFSSRP